MVALRHISACALYNDCMLGWLEPAFSAPEPAALNWDTGPYTGSGRKDWADHTADSTAVMVVGMLDRWDGAD
jgi:hypothetical protein